MSTSITSMGAGGTYRLDPSQLSSRLFSRLDTHNKGYIEKSDLQSAMSETASGNSGTSVKPGQRILCNRVNALHTALQANDRH